MAAAEAALIAAALAFTDAYLDDGGAGFAPAAHVMRTKLEPAVREYRATKQRAALVRSLAAEPYPDSPTSTYRDQP